VLAVHSTLEFHKKIDPEGAWQAEREGRTMRQKKMPGTIVLCFKQLEKMSQLTPIPAPNVKDCQL